MLKQTVYALLAAGVAAKYQRPPPSVYLSHEGTPAGQLQKVEDFDVYHTYGPSKSADNAIIYLPDIFGVQLPQARLLADSYARDDYLVLIPDYFKGDPIPVNMTGFDMASWRGRHPPAAVSAIVDKTVKYARETLKVKRLGVTGYCFGGPYAIQQLAAGKKVDAGFIEHPAGAEDSDLSKITGPLSIAAAETDASFNATRRAGAESVLTKANSTYQINLYSGASHGFAVRVDLADRRQRFAKESAFWQALQWFDAWLKNANIASQSRYVAGSAVSKGQHDLRVPHDLEHST